MEVAGRILGHLSLCIAALQTYRRSLAPVRSALSDLSSSCRDLQTIHTVLENTCELLLRGVCPDNVIQNMIEHPFGPEWAKYDADLHQRLQRFSPSFQDTLMEMMHAATRLREQLNIDEDGKVENPL